MPADKNLKNGDRIFWTQFPSLEKISQNTISLFFLRCMGHIFTIEAVLMSQHRKIRRILEILRLQSLERSSGCIFHNFCVSNQSCLPWSSDAFFELSVSTVYKNVWAYSHDLCVQKRSCLPLSSDAFWKFSPCKLYEKVLGAFSQFWGPKNEAVCCWVQTHFGSFCLAFWMFSASKVYSKKFWVHFTIYVSKNEAVCCLVQTHFGSFRLASLIIKVVGAFSRFLRPKTKLFVVKFRRILEILCLQGLQKKVLGAISQFIRPKTKLFAVYSSDAFWKVSACRIDKKGVGTFSRFMCRVNKHYWLQHFVKMHWIHFIILHTCKSLLGCSGTLWSSWLSHFMRMNWIWTHLDYECTHKLWCASVALCETISNKSWTGTSNMFRNTWTSKEWTDFVKFDLM